MFASLEKRQEFEKASPSTERSIEAKGQSLLLSRTFNFPPVHSSIQHANAFESPIKSTNTDDESTGGLCTALVADLNVLIASQIIVW